MLQIGEHLRKKNKKTIHSICAASMTALKQQPSTQHLSASYSITAPKNAKYAFPIGVSGSALDTGIYEPYKFKELLVDVRGHHPWCL